MKVIRLFFSKSVLSIVLMTLFSAGLFAANSEGGHKKVSFEKRADKVADEITKKLSLTDVQKAKLDDIKSRIVQKKKLQKDEQPPSNAEVINYIRSDKIDKTRLTELLLKKKEAREAANKEFRDLLIDQFVEFHKMLTSKQRDKLAEMLEQHNKRRIEGIWEK